MTEEGKRMNTMTRLAEIFTKIFQVGYSIGAVGILIGLVLFLFDRLLAPGSLVKGSPKPDQAVRMQGFSVIFGNQDGTIDSAALIIFLVTGGIVLGLMTMIFRNANLILRTMQGKTKFSKGKTPFQPDNVRMMREIGIYFIAINVVKIAAGAVATAVIGPDKVEGGGILGEAVIGLLMLCLSQVFAIGTQMQEDIDGLV